MVLHQPRVYLSTQGRFGTYDTPGGHVCHEGDLQGQKDPPRLLASEPCLVIQLMGEDSNLPRRPLPAPHN